MRKFSFVFLPNMNPEISHRIQATWATVREHAKEFYRNQDVDPEVKARTVQPLLLSRLLHNAATWTPLTAGQRHVSEGRAHGCWYAPRTVRLPFCEHRGLGQSWHAPP